MKSFDILNAIIRVIEAGEEWGHSGHLPPQQELQKRFRASNSTIIEVVKALHCRGYILHKGRGTIINPHRLTIPALVSPSFDSFLRTKGIMPYMRNIGTGTFEQITIPKDLIEAYTRFDLPDMQVMERIRIQGEQMPDGFQIPYRISINYYPAELAGPYTEQAQDEPTFNILAALEADHDLRIEQSAIKVWSSFPSKQYACLLLIEPYVPTIEWYRLCMAQSGEIIMMSHIIAPAYRFSIEVLSK